MKSTPAEPRMRKKSAGSAPSPTPIKANGSVNSSTLPAKAVDNAKWRSKTSPRYNKSVLYLLLIPVGLLVLVWQAQKEALPELLQPLHTYFDPARYESTPGLNQGEVLSLAADEERKAAIVKAFKHAWHAYERDAMGSDEYHPIGHKGSNLTSSGGIGYTVVDALDTMVIMGLNEEYELARRWIEESLTFDADGAVNTFEVTIRILGGLLSTYHLTGASDPVLLAKAKDLADRILPAFDTPAGLPLTYVNLAQRVGVPDKDNKGLVSTAEISTMQLEFRYLSELTGEDVYWDVVEQVMARVKKAHLSTGLASIFMSPNDGKFALSVIRLGSRGDSYYEYLLKQYLQTNQTEDVYRWMYDDAMAGVASHLVRKTPTLGLTYTTELAPQRSHPAGISWRQMPKQDHLACFLGGSLMLGAVTTGAHAQPVSVPPKEEELTAQGRRDWRNGWRLIETCMRTHNTTTGLAPEIAHFVMSPDLDEEAEEDREKYAPEDWYIKGSVPEDEQDENYQPPYDARYILRPETIESLFVAYRLTGDPLFREYGWQIFQAIETHCRIDGGGYASVLDVSSVPVQWEDRMETFMMSETLKYLYLLFEDSSVLPLDKYVFNTEAHPFPIFQSTRRAGFS